MIRDYKREKREMERVVEARARVYREWDGPILPPKEGGNPELDRRLEKAEAEARRADG